MHETKERLIRLAEVMDRTALTRSTLYALIKRDEFPSPVRLTATAVAWPEISVDNWIQGRIDAANGVAE
ncbi:helix-turn-helix transcriptional regulator [Paraburkholderia solitsugae]|nr:AlpA family transcriptional regulator [Paraburkholderia solitsugae]